MRGQIPSGPLALLSHKHKGKIMKKGTKTRPDRLRTYVVWLNNLTNKKDDEWKKVKSRDPSKILDEVTYDKSRFTLGDVYTLSEFRKKYKGYSV